MNVKAMAKGICLQTYAPVRKDPVERAEMVTQLLFGDAIEILDDEGTWVYIKSIFDSYEGWVDRKCITFSEQTIDPQYLVYKNSLKLKNCSNGPSAIASIGSVLPEIQDNRCKIGPYEYELDDTTKMMKAGSIGNLENAIQEVLDLPYLWGGRSGFGFDCSGLVQYLCRMAGTQLPRDASEQSAEGQTLSFLNDVKKGDLAFFDDTEGMIHHVGLMLGNGKIIHASGTVRIDRIDQQGIFNENTGTYSHKLRVLKRVIK